MERERARVSDGDPRPRWTDWLVVGVVVAAVAVTGGLVAVIGWQMQRLAG